MRAKPLAKRLLRAVTCPYDPKLVTRRSIVWAYRLFLDRNPETRSVVAEKLRGPIATMRDLRSTFILSSEFADKDPELAPFPLDTIVIADLPIGRRIFVDLADAVIGGMIVRGKYETDVLDLLPRFVKPGMTVLDLGANIGLFSIYLAHFVGETGTVIAFEPIRECANLLRRSIAENGFEDRIVLKETAVGQESGEAEILYVHDARNQGAAFVVGDGHPHCVTPHEIRKVPSVALDECEFEHRIAFIKMDVEGAEPLCVKGARKLLERDRPLILSELHPAQLRRVSGCQPGQYLNQIRRLEYQCFIIDGGKIVPLAAELEPDQVAALLFVPAEHKLAQ